MRETYEETGLLIGSTRWSGVCTFRGDDDCFFTPECNICAHLQSYAEQKQRTVDEDLSKLDYLGRTLTPTHVPIRFAARIFVVDANHTTGVLKPSSELSDVGFYSVTDALAGLEMVDVTQWMLGELLRRYTTGARNAIPAHPFYFYRDNLPTVLYE